MSVAAEIGLTWMRESRRNLRSVKGLIASVLYLLCGALAVLSFLAFSHQFVRHNGEPLPDEMLHQLRRAALQQEFDDTATIDYLLNAPILLYLLQRGSVVFSQILVALIGYDQIAGDLQGRTLRYFSGRAHRASLVVGKALAIWSAVAVITLGLDVFAWVLAAERNQGSAGTVIAYGMHFWCAGLAYLAAYVGLTSFVSATVRSPVIALLVNIGALMGWGIVRRLAVWDAAPAPVHWLRYVTPGEWEGRLLSASGATVAVGALGCLALGAAWLAASSWVLTRRDI